MKVRDYEHRFEETLKSNGLNYTVEIRVDEAAGFKFHYKEFRIVPRTNFDQPLLVTLIKNERPVSYHRRGKKTARCFVVNPYKNQVQWGLRNVWSFIRFHSMPL